LFEAKSIQQYLFRTGRLKDAIAASERLDRLVDENEQSVLYHVLNTANLTSDLIKSNKDENAICFTRCKGGVFYAICQQSEPLLTLRSLWTLTVQQLFPGLDFTDALSEAESAVEVIKQGKKLLAQNRNAPYIKFPIGTAIMKRTDRTGQPSVLMTKADKFEKEWDGDTDMHRQAYNNLNLRSDGLLQNKFLPTELYPVSNFPTNFDEDFWFSNKDNKEMDIAIIHIDGNGLGAMIEDLRKHLENMSDEQYCEAFRAFSSAVAESTTSAAKAASKWLFEVGAYQYKASKNAESKDYIPMRPLILGGDDITLLCHANYAMEYSRKFCIAFKAEAEQRLSAICSNYQLDSNLKLTASGAVLYHKAGHAFTHSHRLVESLTKVAKKLTKQINPKAGPAALAFFRLSSTSTTKFDELKARFEHFNVKDKLGQTSLIRMGLEAYLVEDEGLEIPCIDDLLAGVKLLNKLPMSVGKWRQMASHLALGNKTEADTLYERAMSRSEEADLAVLHSAFKKLAGQSSGSFHQWYWQTEQGQQQTVIADLLTMYHFTNKEEGNK
jgi:hypothetical protein